jgi:hypothetical protein
VIGRPSPLSFGEYVVEVLVRVPEGDASYSSHVKVEEQRSFPSPTAPVGATPATLNYPQLLSHLLGSPAVERPVRGYKVVQDDLAAAWLGVMRGKAFLLVP